MSKACTFMSTRLPAAMPPVVAPVAAWVAPAVSVRRSFKLQAVPDVPTVNAAHPNRITPDASAMFVGRVTVQIVVSVAAEGLAATVVDVTMRGDRSSPCALLLIVSGRGMPGT